MHAYTHTPGSMRACIHAHVRKPPEGWRLSPATTCEGDGSPNKTMYARAYPPSTETSLERTRSLLFPTMMTGRSWWGLPARSLRRVSGTLEKLLRSVTEKTMRKASPVWRQWSLIHPSVSSCRWAGSPGESGQGVYGTRVKKTCCFHTSVSIPRVRETDRYRDTEYKPQWGGLETEPKTRLIHPIPL